MEVNQSPFRTHSRLYATEGAVAKTPFALDPSTEWCISYWISNGHESLGKLLKNTQFLDLLRSRKQTVPGRSKEWVSFPQLPWCRVRDDGQGKRYVTVGMKDTSMLVPYL